jgi:hypothetical protein
VWTTKFARAPGAFDLDRRVEVLDLTGVRRQMMFPGSIGLYAVSFYFRCDQFPDMLRSITGDRKAYALELVRAYNDWCIRVARRSDRVRAVGVALADTVDELHAECKRLIDNGRHARSLRVSLFDIEPVDIHIEQFAMPEIYCYSSDYPHPEGGTNPMGDISGKLQRLGDDVLRKVFVDDAEWLLPD